MASAVERDEWLMAQVRQGRREHFEPLVRRYASPLLTFIERMIGDRHRSEELFQEVFLAVWIKRKQYTFPRPFRSWLFGIAVNRCRAEFRGAGVTAGVSLDQAVAPTPLAREPGGGDTMLATETATLIATAVTRLPAQQRTVVVLRIWGGHSYAEIAEITRRAEATVRSHMHHGLAAMRAYLEPRMCDDSKGV